MAVEEDSQIGGRKGSAVLVYELPITIDKQKRGAPGGRVPRGKGQAFFGGYVGYPNKKLPIRIVSAYSFDISPELRADWTGYVVNLHDRRRSRTDDGKVKNLFFPHIQGKESTTPDGQNRRGDESPP